MNRYLLFAAGIIGAVAADYFAGGRYSQKVADNIGGFFVRSFGTQYDGLISLSAAEFDIDPEILYRLLWKESRFRADIINGTVKSTSGALGIAQFMPSTAREQLGSVGAALDPNIAIPGAARYLRSLIDSTGSIVAAVAAYNWGLGNVKRKGLSMAPAETRDYVAYVTGESIA